MTRLFKILVTSVLIMWISDSCPQNGMSEDNTVAMIKANFLYQMANHNNWPTDAKKGRFYVGVLGSQSVYDYLSQKYGTKPVGSQTMDVLNLTEIPANQFLHIIYIDKSKKSDLAKALKEYKEKTTLIVTNWEGALGQGALVNFKNIDGSVRYELNKSAMEDKKITPGIKILQWAVQ